jgi:hypothetical protein
MPQAPYLYRARDDAPTARFDLTSLGQEIKEHEKKRQDAFEVSRKLQVAIVTARNDLEVLEVTAATAEAIDLGTPLEQSLRDAERSLLEAIATSIHGKAAGGPGNVRTPRTANLSTRVEDYLRLLAFSHFLKTASLLPPSTFTAATDEEYLAGACMGLCQDLARYGMGRATS